MTIKVSETKIHWNYFLALERDLEVVSRYVEFSDKNFSSYSIELAHLLFAAASEVDVLAKLLCNSFDPRSRGSNIDQYREGLIPKIPSLPDVEVSIPRYGLKFCPWDNWRDGKNPDWWRSYNNVKHERNSYFHEATLKNTLNAMGALLIMNAHHYAQVLQPGENNTHNFKMVMLHLDPESSLIKLPAIYYHEW